MSREASPETDDELFNDIYGKAYTGPSVPTANKNAPSGNTMTTNPDPVSKSHSEEKEEEDNSNDPFGIPTDFTSRDKKFWDAKAKATEINFNKRKKEEMICKLCGDPNHFTQGCPSTLGMNKKTNEHFERVPARDKRIRDLFSPETVSRIEKETGCKLALNNKFLIVSSKEPGLFSKGIHKVHGMIQEMREKSIEPEFTQEEVKPSPSPPKSRVLSPPPRSRVSRSPSKSRVSSPSRSRASSPPRSRASSPPRSREKSPRRRGLSPSRRERSPRRRVLSSPRRERGFSPRRERERGSSPSRRSERSYSPRRGERSRSFGRSFENRAREDYYRVSRGSPKDYPAKHGAPSATRRPPYEGQNRNFPPQESYVKTSGWDVEMDLSPGADLKAVRNPRSMEELETELKREEMEMMRARDQQVDQENYMYRERIREMRETYASKFSTLRTTQSKQLDELLQQSFAKQPQNVPQAVHHPYPDPAAQAVHHPYSDPAAQAVHHPYPDPAGTRNNMQYVGPTTVPHNMYPYHDAHGYGQYQA